MKVRVAVIVLALVVLLPDVAQARTKARPRDRLAPSATKTLFIGGGIGFAFFAPTHVNDHMEHFVGRQGSVSYQSGFSAMIFNLVPRFAVTVMPVRFLEVGGLMELGWGPKIITVMGGESQMFNFMRYTPGALLNVHIPISGRRDSIFLGGAFLYNFMAFEDYTANAPGFRAQVGYKMFTSHIMAQGFIAFDYVVGNTGQQRVMEPTEEMVLDYTSVQVGFNVFFGAI